MLPRELHPLAWWAWAVGVAVAVSLTTNPVLLALAFCSVAFVVAARRGSSPWARSFRLYVFLGIWIVVIRVLFHVLVGFKFGSVLVLPLPQIPLPSWAAGIQLFGSVYLDGLLMAICIGLRLAMVVIAVGAANALANPKRMLRTLPRALHDIGTAVVVSVSVAPQLAASVVRVSRARQLRGDAGFGIRALPRVALPVLQDTLDRSLLLASAMESRGYGASQRSRRPTWVPILTLGGLALTCIGLYTVLGADQPAPPDFGLLAAGAVCAGGGVWVSGRSVAITRYRPDPWRWPESVTVLCGIGCALGMLWAKADQPNSMNLQVMPLALPMIAWQAVLGLMVAAIPAFATPAPPVSQRRSTR